MTTLAKKNLVMHVKKQLPGQLSLFYYHSHFGVLSAGANWRTLKGPEMFFKQCVESY